MILPPKVKVFDMYLGFWAHIIFCLTVWGAALMIVGVFNWLKQHSACIFAGCRRIHAITIASTEVGKHQPNQSRF